MGLSCPLVVFIILQLKGYDKKQWGRISHWLSSAHLTLPSLGQGLGVLLG